MWVIACGILLQPRDINPRQSVRLHGVTNTLLGKWQIRNCARQTPILAKISEDDRLKFLDNIIYLTIQCWTVWWSNSTEPLVTGGKITFDLKKCTFRNFWPFLFMAEQSAAIRKSWECFGKFGSRWMAARMCTLTTSAAQKFLNAVNSGEAINHLATHWPVCWFNDTFFHTKKINIGKQFWFYSIGATKINTIRFVILCCFRKSFELVPSDEWWPINTGLSQ